MKYLTIALLVSALGLVIWVAGCKNQREDAALPAGDTASAPAGHDMAGMDHSAPAGHDMAGMDHKASTDKETVQIGADEASCPVLGTVMKKSMMIPVEHNGKTYYLCCQDCVPKFKADPEKYIEHPAAPTHEMAHDD